MPRKTHGARLQFAPRTWLVQNVTETAACGEAQDYSLRHKNKSVVVVSQDGTVKARFLNGKDVS